MPNLRSFGVVHTWHYIMYKIIIKDRTRESVLNDLQYSSSNRNLGNIISVELQRKDYAI